MHIGGPLENSELPILKEHQKWVALAKVLLNAAFFRDEINDGKFACIPYGSLADLLLLAGQIANLCFFNNKRRYVRFNERFNVGVLRIVGIACYLIVNGIDNDDRHIEPQEEIQAVGDP